MKWLPAFLFLNILCACIPAQGQSLDYVDHKGRSLPDSVTSSSSTIAHYINGQFTSDESKVRAAYRWITANIRYDKDSMLYINWSKDTEEKIAATLRRKKGVCDNFASVFVDIVSKMNIPAFVVNGNCKTSNMVSSQGHSWSAVRIKNEWWLCDPTWDISYASTPNFFLVKPADFIGTHFPFDPIWQLLDRPISYREFENGYTSSSNKTPINVADSIKVFMAMDNLQQMEAAARRMKEAGLRRQEQQNWFGYNKMNIAIAHGDKAMQLYNAAVADLNSANSSYNSFVQFRNNLFVPTKNDDALREMIAPAKEKILSGRKKTAELAAMKDNFQYDTGVLEERLHALEKKVEEQILFLKKYFSASVAERPGLFYQ